MDGRAQHRLLARGKQSLPDLANASKPRTIDQKNLVAVYWYEQVAGLPDINVGKVLAAYKQMDWNEPSHPDTALQATASREGWIDTRNMKAIVTTPSGRNMIKSMPVAKKATKK
jgi:hypothetical protein